MVACKCGAMQAKDAHTYRQPFRKNRLGIAYTSIQRVGGAETFLRTMTHVLGPVLSGVAVLSPTIYSSGFRHGSESISELASVSDVLIVWGFANGLESLVAEYPQAKIYPIHHGDLTSTWANEMFAQQLAITKQGVAVNQQVASQFGVDWLPNPVLRPTFSRTPNKSKAPRVLWNHRWSDEKRPELALAIAKALGDKVQFAISAPASIDLPSNCVNIGQTTSNVNWLSGADVFLSTANQEAFGYSLAEAAYVGVPIVSSPYGIGAHVATYVIDSDNPEAWAEAIMVAIGVDTKPAAIWIDANHGRKAVEQWAMFAGADLSTISNRNLKLDRIGGPGTELKKILDELGFKQKASCPCAEVQAKMDQWGADGCLEPENHRWIVTQLSMTSAKYLWRDHLHAAATILLNPKHWLFGLSIDPTNIIGSVLDQAIKAAKSKELSQNSTVSD